MMLNIRSSAQVFEQQNATRTPVAKGLRRSAPAAHGPLPPCVTKMDGLTVPYGNLYPSLYQISCVKITFGYTRLRLKPDRPWRPYGVCRQKVIWINFSKTNVKVLPIKIYIARFHPL